MGIFDSISNGFKNHFDKNRKQREMVQGLQREADAQRLVAFQEEFKVKAKIVAIDQAKRDAAKLSGFDKLRATGRVSDLSEGGPEPGTFFEKLSDFTKKNKARMESNLEKTKKMRAVADQEKGKAFAKRKTQMDNRRANTFGKSSWKM